MITGATSLGIFESSVAHVTGLSDTETRIGEARAINIHMWRILVMPGGGRLSYNRS